MSGEWRIVILYGSETGTAQDVAERIERDAIRRHFCVTIKPLDQYNIVCVLRNYRIFFRYLDAYCSDYDGLIYISLMCNIMLPSLTGWCSLLCVLHIM